MTDQDDLLEQVAIAYADAGPQRQSEAYDNDDRCLKFVTSGWFTSQEAVREALSRIDSYNAFDDGRVMGMVKRAFQADDVRVAVAREGSPAIYLETDVPNQIVDIFGPTRYEADPDLPFADVKPDELSYSAEGDIDYRVGSNYAREPDFDAHSMCRHDDGDEPVAVEDWATPNPDRFVVRAWWD